MKKWALYAVLSIMTPAVVKAQSAVEDSVHMTKKRKVPKVQYGVASFYHNKFEGRKTANGEIFSQKKLTAACNTLPLNCWVRVTNIRNNRSVILRITDRMHHLNKRLIDLSHIAAKTLGYTGHGLTRVKVEYLGKNKPTTP
ncbi:septal ring lytic transglycosylase RlpA family protein [Pseudobacter ginsenosidimutans]|uniref:Probable endolytic peptidoglycan transglycosylase RlpA n=1 Tax=Pseudobacter ginsenosidimutans TaxID=661488 RepID=A0A4V2EZM6_9BACT|nr:septal ring lytic transglycosylase RlpA family protein [Pseudobacter ginsenosidimutans]QEC45486.1 septal ring lytic transglycosylase RlpA family protein [Pseudobacter ginsenosidimutans]RZS67020.1 rare lipoprotein A [Pseudobacter ginsenosidimutans]